MKNRKPLLSGLLIVSIALGLLLTLPAEPVQSGGMPWIIEVLSPATNNGQVIIDIMVDSIRICTTIDVKKEWSIEKKCEEIAKVLNNNMFLDASCSGSEVKVIATNPGEEIKSVQITEIETGEGLTAIKDDPMEEVLYLRAYFCLIGRGTGGNANLKIGNGPLVTVSTGGYSDAGIIEELVSSFNEKEEYKGYECYQLGPMVVINDVPCTEGIVAGTTDKNLSFSFGMAPKEKSAEILLEFAKKRLSRKKCGGDPPIFEDIMVFPTPERFLGSDLNHDGDIKDTILRYQNLKTGETFNTGITVSGAHHAIDIYENIIVFVGEDSRICYYDTNTGTVGETRATGIDPSIYGNIIVFNSKGTICYFDLSTQVLVDTKLSGHSPTIYQDMVVFCASPRGTIWTYDLHTGATADTGAIGWAPTLYETIVAFTTSEGKAVQDLNGDGDTKDFVIRYYDLETQILTSTGAVGKYPALYRNRIVFTTPEKAVNQDLNGDDKILGSVIRYYDLRTSRVVNTQQLGTEPDIYNDTITFYQWEKWTGRDLSHDGDLSDPIVDTYQIAVTEMAATGPEIVLVLALLVISSIAAYFKRR